MVTRLTMRNGRGWATAQVRIRPGEVTGFRVGLYLPVATRSWGGADRVAVPALGIDCVLQKSYGTFDMGLDYLCGNGYMAPSGTPTLPAGRYQVTLPFTGDAIQVGMFGRSNVYTYVEEAGGISDYSRDTFEVIDGDHFQSTAEVRNAPVTPDPVPDPRTGTETVVTSLDIVAGEQVTGVDVTLARDTWRLVGTNAAVHGLQCFVRRLGPILHCRAAPGRPAAFSEGRYTLVANLHYVDPDGSRDPTWMTSVVSMSVDGQPPEEVDQFSAVPAPTPFVTGKATSVSGRAR